MMTKEDYAAKVPNRDERENAARLFDAWHVAETAAWGEPAGIYTAEQEAALGQLNAEYERRRNELYEWHQAERGRIELNDVGPLRAAADAAHNAYQEAPGDAVTETEGEVALRCALSGVPIYDTDVTMEVGGKTILACVLLDPDQIADLTAEDDEDEVVEEAA